MTNRALTAFSLFAFAALLLAAPASAQTTECQPDDLFCAELRIGPGRAGVRIGTDPAPPPPPPPVVVEPAPQPPVVIVQPAPEPPPPPPQPPTVIVQPAPPPPPPPPAVYVPPAPQPVYVAPRRPRDRFPYSSTGLHLHVDGLFGDNVGMGGGGGAFRIRPIPHIAIDLGGAFFVGQDYNGMDRWEVPFTADLLFFFNPQHRFQFYALAGVGASFGHAEGINIHTGNLDSRDFAHLGGQLGLGVEWRIGRGFALNLDVRGFLRERVDDNPRPEFVERGSDGWVSTNTSGGFLGRLGMTFYFAD